MLQFSNLINASAMETRDHSKNGASLKSLKSKKNMVMIFIIVITALSFSCNSNAQKAKKQAKQITEQMRTTKNDNVK